MAQGTRTENTAVNRLIEMAQTKTLDTDDALFESPPPARRPALPRPFPARIAAPADPPAPLPRRRAPQATETGLTAVPAAAPPVLAPPVLETPSPVPPPAIDALAHAPQEDVPTRPFDQLDPELLDEELDEHLEAHLEDDGDQLDDMPITVAEPLPRVAAPIPPLAIGPVAPLAARPSALGAIPSLPGDEAAWFQESLAVDRVELSGPVPRRRSSRARSMLWLSAAFAGGLVATAIVVWAAGKPSVAPARSTAPAASPSAPAPAGATVEPVAPVAAAAVAAAPVAVEPAAAQPAVVEPAVAEPVVVEPVVVEPAAPAPVTVALTSTPPGATVLLVDSGTTVTLGVTPLEHALDPSRAHELMFSLPGHRSTLVALDPSAARELAVDLSTSTAVVTPARRGEAPPPAAAPAGATATIERVAPRPRPTPAPKVDPTPAPRAPKAAPAVAMAAPRAGAPAPAGKGGVLMLGAKPPCEIYIDGKRTGLKTPQRELAVAPGTRTITLVNREHRINQTFTVEVKAGAPTKVVKDLTHLMR